MVNLDEERSRIIGPGQRPLARRAVSSLGASENSSKAEQVELSVQGHRMGLAPE